jgi:hypothetical protein
VSKAHEALLGGFERKILRKVYGEVQIDGIWPRHYNKELYRLCNDVDIIKINRLRWAGHVIRRENEEIIKRIILVKLEGKRKKGRLRMGWVDGMEKGLRNLGVVNWKKGTRTGWLEKFFRAGQDTKRVVVLLIIIIIIIIIIGKC